LADWIPVCDFSIDDDLAELAQFIQRHQLPLRIGEENNRQRLWTLDPRLREPLRLLVQRWRAGEVQLAQVSVQMEEAAPAEKSNAAVNGGEADGDAEADALPGGAISDAGLPHWPWRKTPVSLALIALCFIGWLLQSRGLAQGLIIFPERVGDFDLGQSSLAWHFARGEFWRLWTPAIVHFSVLHALFNALGVWILGRPLEARAGSLTFALFVLISAAVANLVQYSWAPQNIFGGMSGVVYALVGCVFVLQHWQPQWREVPSGIVFVAVIWLLVCATGLIDYFISGGIANAAHLGGFACGLTLTLLYCLLGGARSFAVGEKSTSENAF
jgi:GlpG protein